MAHPFPHPKEWAVDILQSSVESALGRNLSDAESARFPSMAGETAALIVGYLGCDPDPLPEAVGFIAARMVARVFEQAAVPSGVQSVTESAGPFGRTLAYTPQASTGAAWIAASDKIALRPYRRASGTIRLDTEQTGHYRHY